LFPRRVAPAFFFAATVAASGSLFAFFAFFAAAPAPGSSGRRFLAPRAQCSGSMTCRASEVRPSSSSARAPASETSSMAASALLKASTFFSTVGEGKPRYTAAGTRQHSTCTNRPYAPDTTSIMPTRTWFLAMKHLLFLSATKERHTVYARRFVAFFVSVASFSRISHRERPDLARSTLYRGISDSLNASA
jgi:hypothetical protein